MKKVFSFLAIGTLTLTISAYAENDLNKLQGFSAVRDAVKSNNAKLGKGIAARNAEIAELKQRIMSHKEAGDGEGSRMAVEELRDALRAKRAELKTNNNAKPAKLKLGNTLQLNQRPATNGNEAELEALKAQMQSKATARRTEWQQLKAEERHPQTNWEGIKKQRKALQEKKQREG